MEKTKEFYGFHISENIYKEINLLPNEFYSKQKELDLLQKELSVLYTKSKKIKKQISQISNDISTIEENLIVNTTQTSKIKIKQKIIINSINEEIFSNFFGNFEKLSESLQNCILVFLNFKDEYQNELHSLIKSRDNLVNVLVSSYNFYKSLAESDEEKYHLIKAQIEKQKKGNSNIFMNPLNKIFDFIENTFKIIEFTYQNKETNDSIKIKSAYKEKLFIQDKIIENAIKDKKKKINKINEYMENINSVLSKYKNFIGDEDDKILNSNYLKNNNNFVNVPHKSSNTNLNNLLNNIVSNRYEKSDENNYIKKNAYIDIRQKIQIKSNKINNDNENNIINPLKAYKICSHSSSKNNAMYLNVDILKNKKFGGDKTAVSFLEQNQSSTEITDSLMEISVDKNNKKLGKLRLNKKGVVSSLSNKQNDNQRKIFFNKSLPKEPQIKKLFN